MNKCKYVRFQRKPEPEEAEPEWGALKPSTEEMQRLQNEDLTLACIRAVTDGPSNPAVGEGLFVCNGLLYRRWTPKGRDQGPMTLEQLVLPSTCREAVMKVAHGVPLGGHLGKTKTAQRIRQGFYWPTLFRDVAIHCRTCEACQLDASHRVHRAHLIPLPIMSEPFQRIAMDIGPLPKSRSGKRFVLVVCDYATRYPEAVPLRTMDAEHIGEELVQIFSRVGVPSEILTDQGSNFMSQLLGEVYRLLRVKPISD